MNTNRDLYHRPKKKKNLLLALPSRAGACLLSFACTLSCKSPFVFISLFYRSLLIYIGLFSCAYVSFIGLFCISDAHLYHCWRCDATVRPLLWVLRELQNARAPLSHSFVRTAESQFSVFIDLFYRLRYALWCGYCATVLWVLWCGTVPTLCCGTVSWVLCCGCAVLWHIGTVPTTHYHCVVGTVLWVLCCGCCAVGTVLWALCCGYCVVGTVLWVLCCGTVLWVLCHCVVGTVLWVLCCGNCAVGAVPRHRVRATGLRKM